MSDKSLFVHHKKTEYPDLLNKGILTDFLFYFIIHVYDYIRFILFIYSFKLYLGDDGRVQ